MPIDLNKENSGKKWTTNKKDSNKVDIGMEKRSNRYRRSDETENCSNGNKIHQLSEDHIFSESNYDSGNSSEQYSSMEYRNCYDPNEPDHKSSREIEHLNSTERESYSDETKQLQQNGKLDNRQEMETKEIYHENMSLTELYSDSFPMHPELARENLRILALKELAQNPPDRNESIFPIPPAEYELDRINKKLENIWSKPLSSKTYKKLVINDTDSRSIRNDIVKIDCPDTMKVKSFNDFDEGIFKVNPSNKKYICPIEGCTKEFPSLSRIKRHYIIHTDIKPFKCKNKECDRRFSRKDNMLQHYRMHCPFNDTH